MRILFYYSVYFIYFQGPESISDYAISFHYVSPTQMYDLEFYIYHMKTYGNDANMQNLNHK